MRVLFYVVHHVCSLWIWMYFEGNEPTVMRYDAQASGASSSSFLLCVCGWLFVVRGGCGVVPDRISLACVFRFLWVFWIFLGLFGQIDLTGSS